MDNVNDDLVPPTLQVSAADRLQRFREDDQALAELAVKVHERAMGEGEGANAAAHTDLRIRERRTCMWGYDAPQRTDMVLVAQTARCFAHDLGMSLNQGRKVDTGEIAVARADEVVTLIG